MTRPRLVHSRGTGAVARPLTGGGCWRTGTPSGGRERVRCPPEGGNPYDVRVSGPQTEITKRSAPSVRQIVDYATVTLVLLAIVAAVPVWLFVRSRHLTVPDQIAFDRAGPAPERVWARASDEPGCVPRSELPGGGAGLTLLGNLGPTDLEEEGGERIWWARVGQGEGLRVYRTSDWANLFVEEGDCFYTYR